MKSYLENYKCSFSKDIDELWEVHDRDGNGYLDKKEASSFVKEISKCIERERAKNFNDIKFDMLFAKFDENKDSYLSKSEMAVFIKKVFSKGSNQMSKDQPNPWEYFWWNDYCSSNKLKF